MRINSHFCSSCFGDLALGGECARCPTAGTSQCDRGDALAIGSVLGGRFRVGRLLGRGGFGATYLAWDENLEVRIAIKEFLPRQFVAREAEGTRVYPHTGSEEAFQIGLEQFLSEARNLAQFRDYPGIISVLDFFPENGTGYMVMEYLDGCTLEEFISKEGRLESKIALSLLVPVVDALRACHAAGLIHRDISPDNIFLTSDHRIKILDFGAARVAIGQSTNLSVILKPGYAPFEQYQRKGRQGPWTDIYALTATLYRLLTNELPPPAPDRVGGTPMPNLTEKGVVIPQSLQAVLDKGMAIPPEQRFQTVDEFLDAIQAVLEGSPSGSTKTPTASPQEARALASGPARRTMLVFGSLAAIGLLGAAALMLPKYLDHPGTRPPLVAAPHFADNTEQPKPPEKPPSNHAQLPVEFAREYIKQATNYQLQLQLAITQEQKATKSLEALSNILSKTPAIENSLATQGALRDHAVRDRDALLNKYIMHVEWLGSHDYFTVDAALRLERDSAHIPGTDSIEAEKRQTVSHALALLETHVKIFRENRLTKTLVVSGLGRD